MVFVATSNPVSIVERNPFTLNNLSTNPSCTDENDGSILITITGGTPFLNNDQQEDYNHTWFPNNLNGLGLTNKNGSLILILQTKKQELIILKY